MKHLTFNMAWECATARRNVCHCRCGGVFHRMSHTRLFELEGELGEGVDYDKMIGMIKEGMGNRDIIMEMRNG